MNSNSVSLSELDTARFGVVSARAKLVTSDVIPEINAFCAENRVRFLIARCSTSDIKTVHAMEANGYQLMDTLVYLRSDIEDYIPPAYPSELSIQALTPGDIPDVIKVAEESFSAYKGHYHVDPRLDPVKATEVYSSWAERCCTDPTAANHVLVAKLDGELVGFRAIRINTTEQAEFILAGVASGMRRRGIYRAFVIEGLNWCKAAGVSHVLNSTLLINTTVQKVCTSLGFYAFESYHTFHKWFS